MACVRSESIFCWPRVFAVFFFLEVECFPAVVWEAPVDLPALPAVADVWVFVVPAGDLLAGSWLAELALAGVCGLACAANAVAHASRSGPTAPHRKARVPADTLSLKMRSLCSVENVAQDLVETKSPTGPWHCTHPQSSSSIKGVQCQLQLGYFQLRKCACE